MKVVKNVLVVILTIVLILLVSFGIYNFICVKILNQEYAAINGYTVLEVVSGSMEPTIKVGDLIVIDVRANSYEQGDIVTFRDVEGSFVTHRIVSIDEDYMITKGDNNDSIDDEVETNQIIGKYILKLNGVGKLLASFRSPFIMGMILFIGLLICYLISTDKDGEPILTGVEKDYKEFLEYQKNSKKTFNTKKSTTAKKSEASTKKKGEIVGSKTTKKTQAKSDAKTEAKKSVASTKKKGKIVGSKTTKKTQAKSDVKKEDKKEASTKKKGEIVGSKTTKKTQAKLDAKTEDKKEASTKKKSEIVGSKTTKKAQAKSDVKKEDKKEASTKKKGEIVGSKTTKKTQAKSDAKKEDKKVATTKKKSATKKEI